MKPLFEELLFLNDPAARGAALNMAVDEVLLRGVEAPILRVYRWARPAVSFGYFTKWAEVEQVLGQREPVRRWTGGGVVFHGEDVTFSVIVPRTEPLGRMTAAASYRAIHEAVAAALGGGELACAASKKISAACFENPAESDVLVAGRKVVGGAQRRTAEALLHQGSVQMAGVGESFAGRLARVMARRFEARGLRAEELAAAEILAGEKYGTEEWLRRF